MAKLYKVDGTVTEVNPENGKDFQLAELQKMVGGYIEVVPVSKTELAVVNEEGMLIRLPLNENASRLLNQYVVGNVVVINKNQLN